MFHETAFQNELADQKTDARQKKQETASNAPLAPGAGAGKGLRAGVAALGKVQQPRAGMALHLGLRYTLWHGAAGSLAALDPTRAVVPADALQVVLEPNDAGFLYVIERDPAGAWTPLFHAPVAPHALYTVLRAAPPVCSSGASRKLYAILSRRPDPALMHLEPRVLDERLSASLLQQNSSDAVYAVNTNGTPQSQLVALPITLRCR
jgi:hypothetical protein